MVLKIRIIVDGNVRVSLRCQKLCHDIERFLEVAFAVRGRVVSARDTSLQFGRVGVCIIPARWPSSGSREILSRREPIESANIISNKANTYQ